MSEYKIHESRQGASEAVKRGWSWPGFLFSIYWVLLKKMWGLGIGLVMLFVILLMIVGWTEGTHGKDVADGMRLFTILLGSVVIGANGNRWREAKLQARGYEHKHTVSAAAPKEAITTWIKNNEERRSSSLDRQAASEDQTNLAQMSAEGSASSVTQSNHAGDAGTNDTVSTKRAKIGAAFWLVFSQILGLALMLFVAVGPTFLSILFGCSDCIVDGIQHALGSYPIFGFICIVGSWSLFAFRKYAIASVVSALPLLSSPLWLNS